ncbi:MAG: hypothetical protein QOH08_1795 [Chloroflexota bacterium]|nr:hypothetical protein [Chloroflexota bacterium]
MGDRARRGPERGLLRNRWTVAAALATIAIVASACGGAAAPSDTGDVPTLYADLSDYRIVTDHPTVAAGRVVFGIRNHAAMAHELVVIKTDLAPDQLPLDGATAKARDDGKVGELLNIGGGASRKLVLDLVPGKYVLICNIAGHYQLGMRAALVVQ